MVNRTEFVSINLPMNWLMNPAKRLRACCAIVVVLLAACGDQSATSPPSTGGETSKPAGSVKPHQDTAVIARISGIEQVAGIGEASRIFVFLRRKGERMPLGVEQVEPGQLPMDVMFTYPDSSEGEFDVVARLSMSGMVNKSAGDLEVMQTTRLNPGVPVSLSLSFGEGEEVASTPLPSGHPPVYSKPEEDKIVTLEVSLGDQVTLSDGAMVFVIAKDGPGMPLAVKRVSPRSLPATIHLSDADAMLSMNRISQKTSFEVFARLSQSGQAAQRAGDWVSDPQRVEWASLSDQPIALRLATVVP